MTLRRDQTAGILSLVLRVVVLLVLRPSTPSVCVAMSLRPTFAMLESPLQLLPFPSPNPFPFPMLPLRRAGIGATTHGAHVADGMESGTLPMRLRAWRYVGPEVNGLVYMSTLSWSVGQYFRVTNAC